MFKLVYMYYGVKEFVGTYDEVLAMISGFDHEKVLDVKAI